MKLASPSRSRAHRARPVVYRPLLETLEERLPPGDALLGLLWAGPLLNQESTGWAREERSQRVDVLPSVLSRTAESFASRTTSYTAPRAESEEDIAPRMKQSPTLATSFVNGADWFGTAFDGGVLQGINLFAAKRSAQPVAFAGKRETQADPVPGAGPTSVSGAMPARESGARGFVTPPPVNSANIGLPEQAVPAAAVSFPGVVALRSASSQSAVHARFDLADRNASPFPSDIWTVPDDTQNTGLRINLPLPNPVTHPSDYEDTQVINELDGFNMQPRLSIPFDGPIDLAGASRSVFLISLGDTLNPEDRGGRVVKINQIVWDPPTNTLHAESDELLDQHTRYALIVTNRLRAENGTPIQANESFANFRSQVPGAYKDALEDAIRAADGLGIREDTIVTASVFTTQSTTAILEKIRDQIKAETPAPADFLLGPGGTRTVFDLDDVAGLTHHQHTRVDPPGFTDGLLFGFFPFSPDLLRVIPGAVSQIAWGRFVSPDYMVHPGEYIPPVGTRTGTPAVQGINDIYFYLSLPSGPKPEGGWPVAIYGHGIPSTKEEALLYSASLAQQGVAALAIDYVGHGFGPLSTMTVQRNGGDSATFPVGGRGRDQNNNNLIASGEGVSATRPRAILDWSDGMRQTVADWMQLVRVIQVGMDVDGDGASDLDPAHINYYGGSGGGIFGPVFVAVEPDVRSGLFNVGGGGGSSSIYALAAVNRPATGAALNARVPSLLNPIAGVRISEMDGVPIATPRFHENLPLRDGVPLHVRMQNGTAHTIQSPVVNTIDGAIAIQQYLENQQWASLSGDPLGYARHLRKDPLPGVPAKSVLFVFAKGDQQVPNPTTTALIRAGDLADRATLYRHDVAFAEHPTLPKNPHVFSGGFVLFPAVWAPIGLEPQRRVATFLASGGETIIHPEPQHYYEVPVTALPEELNFIV